MTSMVADEPRRFWTGRRALATVGALIGWTIVPPAIIGFTSAHLMRTAPGTNWRGLGATLAIAVFLVGLGVGSYIVWRQYRRHVTAGVTGEWERRESARQLAVGTVWRDCAIVGLILGIAAATATRVPPGAPRIALGIVATLALAYGIVRGTVLYMARIDEQDRDANLWSGYVGVTLYITLYFIQHLAGNFGLTMPRTHDAIFAVVLLATGGTYLWKRYR